MTTAAADLSPRARAAIIATCFLAVVFDGYDLIIYGSTAPALLAHEPWDLSPSEVGHIGSYAMMGMFVGAVSAGWLADRVGHRRVFLGCLALYSAAMIFVALSPNPTALSWTRFVAGLGFGGIAPAAVALVTAIAPAGRRNQVMTLMLIGLPVGGIVAAYASKLWLADHGFRPLWAFGALALVTVLPLAWKCLPELPRSVADVGGVSTAAAQRALLRPRALPTLTLLSAANFAGLLLVFGLNTWLPTLMKSAGYSLGSALTLQVLLNVGAVIGGLTGAALADRFGSRWVATSFFGIAAAAIYAMSQTPSPDLMRVVTLLAGVGTIGTQMVLFGYVAGHYPAATRATALGITSGIGRLGAVCGPTIGGWLLSNGASFDQAFGFFALVAAVGAAACITVPRPGARPVPAVSAPAPAPAPAPSSP